jgi:hypothetical protein
LARRRQATDEVAAAVLKNLRDLHTGRINPRNLQHSNPHVHVDSRLVAEQ